MDPKKQQSQSGSSMLNLGDYTIQTILADNFRLDGGAMFGSVPKTLWERSISADEKNRIQLTCRVMVVQGHGHTILVDTGMGNKWTEKESEVFTPSSHSLRGTPSTNSHRK
jgi:hypothetical protein